MSVNIRKKREERSEAEKASEGTRGRRIHVNLSLDEQLWTLAKERLPNVSRIVEQLLKMALNQKSSIEIVRIGESGERKSVSGMSAALARQVHSENGLTTTAQTKKEPLQEDIFTKGFKETKTAEPLLNHYWNKYKDEFNEYVIKQVEDGKLSKARYKSYMNALNKFFKNNQVNEATDFIRLGHLQDQLVKGLKKFFKFLLELKYKEVDTKEIEAMNRQVKVKSSPKLQGKPADEKTMKKIIDNLEKEKDYRYYLYKLLIYSGLRLSHAFELLKEIAEGKITEKDLIVKDGVAAFDINRFSKGKKKVYYAFMPSSFAKELLENKDLFKKMPKSDRSIKFLKKAAKRKAGASNIRDWFLNKAIFKLKANRTLVNFMQGRADEKGAWLNYVSIKQELESAIKEYKKLMTEGMFNFLS